MNLGYDQHVNMRITNDNEVSIEAIGALGRATVVCSPEDALTLANLIEVNARTAISRREKKQGR